MLRFFISGGILNFKEKFFPKRKKKINFRVLKDDKKKINSLCYSLTKC